MIVDDNESTRREENEIIKEIYLKEKIKKEKLCSSNKINKWLINASVCSSFLPPHG